MNTMNAKTKFHTFTTACPITDARLLRLARLIDRAPPTERAVPIVGAIARTRHPEAIELLAALLDYPPGETARALVVAIASFGEAAVPAMRRVVDESLDSDAIAHAEMALARIEALARRRARRALGPDSDLAA